MKKVLLIINPNSNNGKAKRHIQPLIEIFKKNLIDFDYITINNFEELKEISKTKAKYYSHIGACGGDGTLNAVVNEFINCGKTFFFIPLGTINIFAREFSIPQNPVKAVKKLIAGKEIELNLFYTGKKYVLLMISAGLDSYTVNKVNQTHKTHSKWLYIFGFLKNSLSYTYPDIKIRINDKILFGKFIFAGQSTRYAGYLNFIPHSTINDGWINVCLLKKQGLFSHLAFFIKTLFGLHTKSKNVEIHKTKELNFLGPPGVVAQIDGDSYESLPSNFTLADKKVRILVP